MHNTKIHDTNQILSSLKKAKKTMHFNNAIIARLFISFIDSSYSIAEDIHEAIQIKNKKKIQEKMHALRGILLSLQINELAKTCESIEYDHDKLDEENFMNLSQNVYNNIIFIQKQKDNILEGIVNLD